MSAAGAVRAVRPVVLHHDLGRAAFLTLAGVGALVVADGAAEGRAVRLLQLLALAGVAALLGWRPAVVVDDLAVTLVNPLRTVRVPWPAVEDVAMGWTLTVTAGGVRHRAWAAPGPRRMRSLYERRWTDGGILERLAVAEVERAGAGGAGALGLGDAGIVVAQRWAERAALVPGGPVQERWSRSALALVAATVLAAAAAAVTGIVG